MIPLGKKASSNRSMESRGEGSWIQRSSSVPSIKLFQSTLGQVDLGQIVPECGWKLGRDGMAVLLLLVDVVRGGVL